MATSAANTPDSPAEEDDKPAFEEEEIDAYPPGNLEDELSFWVKGDWSKLPELMNGFPQVSEVEAKNFLSYNRGDVSKARAHLKAAYEWREANLPIAKHEIINVLRQGFFYIRGRDLQGNLVAYFTAKGCSRGKEHISQYIKTIVYQSEEIGKVVGRGTHRVTLIVDRTGASLFDQNVRLYKAFFRISSLLYPMCTLRVIMYPANTFAYVLWSILRPFVHPHVQRSLIFASDTDDLKKYIAPDQLRKSLGGTDEYDLATEADDTSC